MTVPRVLHVAPNYFGKAGGIVGGAERYVTELARHMAEKVPTELLSFGPEPKSWELGALKVRVEKPLCYVRGQKNNPFYPALWKAIRGADVVHFHQKHILNSSFGAVLCRLLGKKAFVTDLGGGGWDVSGYVDTDGWYRAELHLSRFARQIAASSRGDSDPVILGGVDTQKFSPGGEARQGEPYFLCVGRLFPHKGADLAIEAVRSDMRLVVVGQPYDERYFGDLKKLAEGKRVEFLHDVDDTKLIELYRGARALILTSRYRDRYGHESRVPELLGQTLLEGMACGVAAVASDVASLPEIVRHEVDGFIVKPEVPALAEVLERLWANPELATSMGKAARDRVLQKFTWDDVVHRCLDAYGA